MQGLSRWTAVVLLLLSSACASKKAIVTMPQSGNGVIGDELATVEVKPCRATSTDPGTCVHQVNECPYGIGRVKLVREGSKLLVTPYCFIPAPMDPVDTDAGEEIATDPSGSDPSDAGPTDSDPSGPGSTDPDSTHEDPGDL